MAENSKIEWCDHTFNPWEGCTKVSPGCAHCYAEVRNNRFGGGNWGKGKPRRRTSESNWRKPLKWNNYRSKCVECGFWNHPTTNVCQGGSCVSKTFRMQRPRVFCASLADWLDDEVPIEWLADLLKLIHDAPNLDWLLLTKRSENWRGRIQEALTLWEDAPECAEEMSEFLDSWLDCINMPERGVTPNNVWIGTSVEDQQRANERIPELLSIPAKVRFLSVEPMLEKIDLFETYPFPTSGPRLHWAIFGGESGSSARPCDIGWIRLGLKECRSAGIAAFVKQLGRDPQWSPQDMREGWYERFSDKKGGDMSEWPADLRIREFPKLAF